MAAFYRFAVEHPDGWAALEQQRLEHSSLGSGTLERFVPSTGPKSEAVIEVRLPPALVERFRTFAMQENRKKDWRRFEEVLKKHRVKHLYHFTDIRNLDSIREHGGLYSWWRCKLFGC